MARIVIFMGGAIGLCALAILIAMISDKVSHRQESKRVQNRRLQKELEAVQTRANHLLKELESLDSSARAEYAVNSNNVFAATVSDSIERFKKKRSIT